MLEHDLGKAPTAEAATREPLRDAPKQPRHDPKVTQQSNAPRKCRASAANSGPHLVDAAHNWHKFDPHWSRFIKFGQIWSHADRVQSAHIRLIPGKLWATSDDASTIRIELGPHSAEFGPKLIDCGRTLAEVCRCRSNIGRHQPKPATYGRFQAQIGRCGTHVPQICCNLAPTRRTSTAFGWISANFGAIRAESACIIPAVFFGIPPQRPGKPKNEQRACCVLRGGMALVDATPRQSETNG